MYIFLMAQSYDLIVIGGGIVGCGIARDAAARGLSVALLEQRDFGGATTAATSKLIHGGLRYLETFEFGLVHTSLQERERLLVQAGHLVKPLPLLLPHYAGDRVPLWKLRVGLTLYDALARSSRLPRHAKWSRHTCLDRLPSLNPRGLDAGLLYYDTQVIFPERLCLSVALTAKRLGADLRNYHQVERVLVERGRVHGVAVRHLLTGATDELLSPCVVNVSGPWHNHLLATLGLPTPAIELVRGSHLVVTGEGLPSTAVYATARSDGRQVFYIPWRGMWLIGTTEVPHRAAPDRPVPSGQEIGYLLDECRLLFPGSRPRVLFGFAGLRALPTGSAALHQRSRRHLLHDHGRHGGPNGLLSVIGGKMTIFRATAEDVVDAVAARQGKRAPGRTADHPLDGAVRVPLEDYTAHLTDAAAAAGLTRDQIEYFVTLYGTRAETLVDFALGDPALRERLCPHQPDIAAQIRFVNDEDVNTLEDFLWRRTGIGSRTCLGLDCAASIARRLARELGWSAEEERRQVAAYLNATAAERTAAATVALARPAPPPTSLPS